MDVLSASWYYNGGIYIKREGGVSYTVRPHHVPDWGSGEVIETLAPADYGGEVRDGSTGASYIKCPITPEEIKEEYRHLIDENWHITENNYSQGEYWQDIYWYVDETGQPHIAYEHITDSSNPLANTYFMDPQRFSYTPSEITIPGYLAIADDDPSDPDSANDGIYKTLINDLLEPRLGDLTHAIYFGYLCKDLQDVANRIIPGHIGYRLRQRDIDQISDYNIRNNQNLGSSANDTPPNFIDDDPLKPIPDEEDGSNADITTITLADADTANYYWEKMVEIDLTKIPVDRYPEKEIIFSEVPLWITGTPKKRITIIGLDTIIVSNINKYWEGNPNSGAIHKPSEGATESEKIRVAEELANDSRVKPVGIIGAGRIYWDLVTPVESPFVCHTNYGLSKDGVYGIMRYLTYPRYPPAKGNKYVKGYPFHHRYTSVAQWNRWVVTYDDAGGGAAGELAIDDHSEYWTKPTNWENYLVVQKVALVVPNYQMACFGGGWYKDYRNASIRLKYIRFVGSRVVGTEPGVPLGRPAWWSEYYALGRARPKDQEYYYTQSFRRGDNFQTAIKEGPPPHMPVDITGLGWKSIRAGE
jgi:hypothetical protein